MLTPIMVEQPETATQGDDALSKLRAALNQLHLAAGKPSAREISRGLHGLPSHTTVNSVLRSRKSCKWAQLEPIVHYLHGDVETFHGLWMATQVSAANTAGPITVREFNGDDSQQGSDQIRFRKFTPKDLDINCILPHALDDQWVPRSQLRLMAANNASLEDISELRHNLIRREYVRSLITAEQVVINRSFLIRNPVIAAGYMSDPDSRRAFSELLSDGAIMLFLIRESSPLDSEWAKESGAARDAAKALEPILRTVRASCVRLSWEADNDERIDGWNRSFADRIKRATMLDHERFLEDVGASGNDVPGFRRQVNLLPRLATPSAQVPITRSNLYEEYLVRDRREIAQGRYDFEKPYIIPLKWLFDLIYNSNLATELRLALTSPADSVHRSLVHSPNFFQDEISSDQDEISSGGFHPSRVRAAIMETIQDALFRRDFTTGALSVFETVTLSEVVTIRKSELWRKYTDAVSALLAEPWLLPHPERGLLHVYRCYDELVAYIAGRTAP
jgi:hypothetical protein